MPLPIPRRVLIRMPNGWISGSVVKQWKDEHGQCWAEVVWQNVDPPPFWTQRGRRPFTDLRPIPDPDSIQ